MLESALDSEDLQKCHKYIKYSMKASNGLLMLVNDLLDFSQFINGKLRMTFEEINILSTVKDVAKIIKFQAKRKGLEFIIDCKFGKEMTMKTDSNRLKQILFNLLGNSLKFTQKGYIKLLLQINKNSKEEMISFSVEDTGIGIKPKNISRLFNMFGKLEQKDKSINKGGVGLGLSICQVIVKCLNHNAENIGIKVESQFGKGSIFSFLLPIYQSQETSADKLLMSSRFEEKGFDNSSSDRIIQTCENKTLIKSTSKPFLEEEKINTH
jgi:signal transduction histidine kinase